jgi:hypothetical protein
LKTDIANYDTNKTIITAMTEENSGTVGVGNGVGFCEVDVSGMAIVCVVLHWCVSPESNLSSF